MRKLALLLMAVFTSMVLLTSTAFAAPLVNSPTEPDPPVEIEDPDVPLAPGPEDPDDPPVEIEDPNVPLAPGPEDPDGPPVEIEDPGVPLAPGPEDPGVPSPQTGVTALAATECMGLLSAGFAAGGAAMLAKAQKRER